jgi:hypothetical protein
VVIARYLTAGLFADVNAKAERMAQDDQPKAADDNACGQNDG